MRHSLQRDLLWGLPSPAAEPGTLRHCFPCLRKLGIPRAPPLYPKGSDNCKEAFFLKSPNALFEKTIFERFLKRKIDGVNHFPFKAPDICWACRLSQSEALTVSLWTTLSWSQGTSFVMFHILEFRCCIFKGQRFHKTRATHKGGQEGVRHPCHYFFPLLQGLCFLGRPLRKRWADCF